MDFRKRPETMFGSTVPGVGTGKGVGEVSKSGITGRHNGDLGEKNGSVARKIQDSWICDALHAFETTQSGIVARLAFLRVDLRTFPSEARRRGLARHHWRVPQRRSRGEERNHAPEKGA